MAIILNDNIDTRAPKPTDNRFGPYTTTAAALDGIPAYQRYVGLTVGVGTPIVEWWFDNTLTLVKKTSSGDVIGIAAGNGIDISGTGTLTIAVTSPTQLTTNLSTDVIADGASDVKYPSVKATKAYVDSNVAGLLDDRGNYPATSGTYPTTGGSGPSGAIRKGDLWFISVPGNLNGIAVQIGASVRALKDDAGPTNNADWDILDTGLGFIPENVSNKVTAGSSITSDPNSDTKYASLKALTEYLASIPPSTPTLEQVLAITPSQTSTGYDINLQNAGGNSKTNVGLATISVTNVSAGNSITAVPASVTIASTGKKTEFTSDTITFTNSSKTLAINAVANNNTVTLPNQTKTLVASVNNSIYADASTGDITIPYVGGTGTENFITKWNADGKSLTNSIIKQIDNETIEINSNSGSLNTLLTLNTAGTSATSTIINFKRNNIQRYKVLKDGANDFRIAAYDTVGSYLGDGFKISSNTLNVTLESLVGTGTRMVVASSAGLLSTQNIPSNIVTGTGTINVLPKWSTTGTTLTDSSIYDNSTSVGIGTQSPNSINKLEVSGRIATTSGINLDTTPSVKTGIYSGSSTMNFYAGGEILSTYKLNKTVVGSYFEHTAGFTNNGTPASGSQNVWRLAGGVTATTAINTIDVTQLLIDPTYTQSTFGTGILRGVYYNPSGTVGTSKHIAFENTKGDNYLNSTSGNTLIGYSTSTEITPFKLEVNGEISTVTGVRIAANRVETGIYPYDAFGGGLTFYAADNNLATFRLTNPGGQFYIFDAGHTYDNSFPQLPTASMVIQGNVSPTGPNSVPITQLLINPSYNQTPDGIPRGTGTLRGIYYAPSELDLNTSPHIAFENTTGNVLLGTTSGRVGIATSTPNAATKLDVSGYCHIGTGAPSGFIGSLHTMEITATGTAAPLTLIGGTSIIEIWSNITRSAGAVSYGAAFPGALPDGNVHISTYVTATSSWEDRIIVEKDQGRVRIGAGSSTAVASALLEVSSTTKGFLPPRMNTAQMNAIASPAEGLIVYNTDAHALVIYGGSPLGWQKISMVPFV